MLRLAVVFLILILGKNCCFAILIVTNDFDKYGFISHRNMLIERSEWGYRLRYSSKKANSCAYAMGKILQAGDFYSTSDEIAFSFKARLYPVAPNTQHLRKVIRAYIKNSLGQIIVRKIKSGTISAPAFVVSLSDNLSTPKSEQKVIYSDPLHKSRKVVTQNGYRSFPVQYNKCLELSTEDKEDRDEWEYINILFRDTRLMP